MNSKIEWPEKLSESFFKIVKEQIDLIEIFTNSEPDAAYRIRKEHAEHQGCCASGRIQKIHKPENEMTQLEKIATELISDFNIKELLPSVAETLSKISTNIIEKGKQEGYSLTEQEEIELLKQIIHKGINREIAKQLKEQFIHDDSVYSKQPLLLAHPSGFEEKMNKELDYIPSQTVFELMNNDYIIWDDFLEKMVFRKIRTELELLEYDGRFASDFQAVQKQQRNDKILWLSRSQLHDAQKNPGKNAFNFTLNKCSQLKILYDLFYSFAFELNKKVPILGMQVPDPSCVCFFAQTGSYHTPYIDSGFGESDSGRKFTIMYFVSTKNEGSMNMTINRSDKEEVIPVQMKKNRLVLVKSRKAKYEFPEYKVKRFVINFYLTGPSDGIM